MDLRITNSTIAALTLQQGVLKVSVSLFMPNTTTALSGRVVLLKLRGKQNNGAPIQSYALTESRLIKHLMSAHRKETICLLWVISMLNSKPSSHKIRSCWSL